MKNKTVIVILHRDRSFSRLRERNLRFVLKYYCNNLDLSRYKICVIEQDNNKTLNNIGKDIDYILLKNSGPFNRSWGFNAAWKNYKEKYENYIFSDNDIIVPVNSINKAVTLLEKYDSINPMNSVRDLNEKITKKAIKTDIKEWKNFPHSIRTASKFAGGVLAITEKGFRKIKGWDEDFEGWGGEDNAIEEKIKNLLTYSSINETSYHLFHDKISKYEKLGHDRYKKNVMIWKNYINNFKETFKKSKDLNEIGNHRKYE